MRSGTALSLLLALSSAVAGAGATPLLGRGDDGRDQLENRALAEIEGAGEVVNSTTVFTESETAPITSLKMFTPTAASSSAISASSVQVSTPEGVSIPAANTTFSAGALSTTTGKAEAAASPTASASVMGGARRRVDLGRGAGWVVGVVLSVGGLAVLL